MCSRLSHLLYISNILMSEQHGFRKLKTLPSGSMIVYSNVVTKNAGQSNFPGFGIDLDLIFFFPKLHFYGIEGIRANWFIFHFTNRNNKI